MKFSLVVTTTVFTFAVSLAVPVTSHYGTADDLVARAMKDLDTLSAREWIDLYARTGSFAETNAGIRKAACDFVDEAKKKGHLALAASPDDHVKTYFEKHKFHLDRQQPSNTEGQHKVAVQLDQTGTSTIGQVVIHKDAHPSVQTVAYKLKKSIKSGKEKFIHNFPPSKKQQNIAKNEAARKAKQARIAAKLKAKAKAKAHLAAEKTM